jgi:hypothetical protein
MNNHYEERKGIEDMYGSGEGFGSSRHGGGGFNNTD